jgi:hypothetical protein
MAIALTGNVNVNACLRRVWESALHDIDNGAPIIPIAKNNELVYAVNAAGTSMVGMIRLDSSNQVRVGSGTCAVKIFNRPTTDAFALQVKSEFSTTNSGHNCIEVTADWKAAGATGGGNTAVQGTSRLAASYTATGGTIIGTYGQFCNLGTLNGSGIMGAGLYGLIEDGGVYTAVSHIASGWLDSHLTKTVSAGNTELLYMSNNGTTTLDSAIYLYPGNKITNLITIDSTDTGLVSAETAGAATITNWRKVKCYIHGATKYLVVGDIA